MESGSSVVLSTQRGAMAAPAERRPSAPRRRGPRVMLISLVVMMVASILVAACLMATIRMENRNALALLRLAPEALVNLAIDPHSRALQGDLEKQSDRGILLCVHDGIVAMAMSLIRELRCLGNGELIQVYYCFSDDLSPASRALLARIDTRIEFVDVCSELLKDPTWFANDRSMARKFKNYWIKPLAVCHTRLSHVILLDADDVLLRDPADLRLLSGYNRTGTTFFHDRIAFMRKFFNKELPGGQQMLQHIVDTFDYAAFDIQNPTPSAFLLQSFAYRGETGHEMDSSMVLIDKTRAGRAMDVLKYLILKLRFEFAFSWGDKEAFWIAFELAQQPYFFSPYGLSLVDSIPNQDLVKHPATLCGSMAHFLPTENENSRPELLYVNGKALLEPFPLGLDKSLKAPKSRMYNLHPTRVTPRYRYADFDLTKRKGFECMNELGSVELPPYFQTHLLRRRYHFLAAEGGLYDALARCEV